LLANYFLEESSKRNKKDIRGFNRSVMDIFMNYDWPGNVRELENIVERSVILCPYDQITIECLPHKLRAEDDLEYSDADNLNLMDIEKKIILRALDRTSWNQSKAAVLLGITRKQLRTKMKNLQLLQKTDDK
jgi:DNA-binding NtrC family response regulator